MSPELATVFVALIGALGGIITAVITKRQKVVKATVEKQNIFIEKEKGIRQKLNKKQKEKEDTIHEVMILILDTNMTILKNTQGANKIDEDVIKKSEELKKRFVDLSESMNDIYKEYELVLEMTKSFEDELNNIDKK